MVELSLEEVAARFKLGDPIRWSCAPSKKRPQHMGVGTYEGTLNGKILVRYGTSRKYAMQKTVPVDHRRVLLDDPQSIPVPDGGSHMATVEETEPEAWCLWCEREPDSICVSENHDVATSTTRTARKPDLTGTPDVQHDVNYF